MLLYYLTLTLLLVSGLRADDSSSSSSEEEKDAKEALRELVQKKCLKNADEDALQALRKAAKGLKECIVSHIQEEPTTVEVALNQVCSEISQALYVCVEGLVDLAEPCLDAEEKYLPDLILSSFNRSVEQNCKDGGAGLKDQILTLKEAKCAEEPQELAKEIAEKCVPKLKLSNEDINENTVLKQADLCSDMEKLKDCVIETVKDKCEGDKVPKIVGNSFEPVLSWCSSNSV